MKNIVLILLIFCSFLSYSQTVSTYAGKVNDDGFNKYESGSSVALDNTYFSFPEGITFDANGIMYISERNKVRIVTGDKLYIRAGSLQSPTNSEGYKNANGTQATFRNPGGMVSDASGNMFVVDMENHAIRKINQFINIGNTQAVSTFAGANPTTGAPGYGTNGSNDGTGTSARFDRPVDITRDANGYFYVTDYNNFTIRKISSSGVVTTLAGAAGVEGTSDGTGGSAKFGGPWGIAMLDANNIVVTDPWNTNIRKINIFSGVTTTLAGPTNGADQRQVDGTLSEARFHTPKGIVVVNGIIYVTDRNVIRAIDVGNNSVTTFAGNKNNFTVTDGTGSNANFTELSDITTDGLGNLFTTENSDLVASSVIRKVTINNLAPAANFTSAKRNISVNEKMTLEDISTGLDATARTWSFDKQTYTIHSGSLSSKQLEVSFEATGFYSVTLSITNEYGTDSKYVEAYFSVSTTGSIAKYANTDLLQIYPNPATDMVTLALDASLYTPQTTVNLYNTSGELITNLNNKTNLVTNNLANGTYYITVKNNEVSFAKKLIITH
jgi:PKD repeat protein